MLFLSENSFPSIEFHILLFVKTPSVCPKTAGESKGQYLFLDWARSAIGIATKITKWAIIDIFEMEAPHIIPQSPEKPNISYVLKFMEQHISVQHHLTWLVEKTKKNGKTIERQCSINRQSNNIGTFMQP